MSGTWQWGPVHAALDQSPRLEIHERVYWEGEPPPFEPKALVSTDANRWNTEGVPTIYLAGDVGLALVEGGRHMRERSGAGSDRTIWSVEVRVDGILDVRAAMARASEAAARTWVFDHSHCHALVDDVRQMAGVSGMVVPSAGSLDDLSRWNLVLYADRIDRPLIELIGEPRVIGRVVLDGEPG